MALVEIYGDESGDFAFSGKAGASRYFIVTTIAARENTLAHQLLNLRRDLMWEGYALPRGFHAQQDSAELRERVYAVIAASGVRIDSTIVAKSEVSKPLQRSNLRFFHFVWFAHLRHVIPRSAGGGDQVMVVGAAIRTQMSETDVRNSLGRIVAEAHPGPGRAHIVNASTDPMVQAADYCGWAVQRKWERGDFRAYNRVRPLIASEHELFGR